MESEPPARHVPVMVAEVLCHLAPERGGIFVDCTVGAGGHASALLRAGATRVIGLDRDAEALAVAASVLLPWRDRVELVQADYRDLSSVLDRQGLRTVDGVLADLGVSSLQLEGEGRGFSFRRDEPLDMRIDRSQGLTAARLIGEASEETLAEVIRGYGEERYAGRIARALVAARRIRPIETTAELATIVRRAIPRRRWTPLDTATRTFQAIRIWVNRELDELDVFLREAMSRLVGGARLVVISFQSLEDRIVKHTLRAMSQGGEFTVRILTKRPLVPSEDEIRRNPRARSAKLRAAERLA